MKQKPNQNFSRYSKKYHKLAKIQHLVAKKLIEFAKNLLKVAPVANDIKVLGPAPALHYKVRDKFRYRFLIKCRKNINLQHFITSWIKSVKIPSSVHLKVDIDPYYFS